VCSLPLFASIILSFLMSRYLGDPLQDFTSMAFLDRFMYKNPKQLDKDVSGGVTALRARRAARPQVCFSSFLSFFFLFYRFLIVGAAS
jgi:hypothetical protein